MNDEFRKRTKFIEAQFIKKIVLHSYFQIKQIPSFFKFLTSLKVFILKNNDPLSIFTKIKRFSKIIKA
jgi:hypothetical protein